MNKLELVEHVAAEAELTKVSAAAALEAVLEGIAKSLKKGGVLLLIDHAAMSGHGSADASALHRIEESYARADFEKRGLHVIATSALLRRADDAHDKISYKPPMLGKTDRFVLVFRKD